MCDGMRARRRCSGLCSARSCLGDPFSVQIEWEGKEMSFAGLSCTDFVAGAVDRELWTCGPLSKFGESISLWLKLVCVSVFVAKRTGRAARCESGCSGFVAGAAFCGPPCANFAAAAAVLCAWQVQRFVSFEVPLL